MFYSNRSAALCAKGLKKRALDDAEECIRRKPDWPKGYVRKGAALPMAEHGRYAYLLDTDGFTVFPGAIDAVWLGQMRAAFDAIHATEGRSAGHEARPLIPKDEFEPPPGVRRLAELADAELEADLQQVTEGALRAEGHKSEIVRVSQRNSESERRMQDVHEREVVRVQVRG